MEKSVKVVPWWDAALKHLAKEPHFAAVIKDSAGDGLWISRNLFRSMVRAVCGQQVNNAAAVRLSKAVITAAKAKKKGTLAKGVLALKETGLKECGLSPTKTAALLGLAAGFDAGRFTRKRLSKLNDEAILAELQSVKGVGPWTAHMILIFGLNRPDVFAAGDFGVKESFRTLFGNLDTMLEVSNAWKPYRTAATWLLWRSRTPNPVRY